MGTSRPKYIEWVKKFVLESLDDHRVFLIENLEEWEYIPNPDINEETYLALF